MKTKPQGVHIMTYKGFPIHFSRMSERLHVILSQQDCKFVDADSAKHAIDRHLKIRHRATKENMKLPVLYEDGTRATITGAHSRTGAILISPANPACRGSTSVYVDHDMVIDILVKLCEAKRVVADLQKQVDIYRVEAPYRTAIRDEADYVARKKEIQRSYERARKGKTPVREKIRF